MIDRTIAPATTNKFHFQFIHPEKIILPNGIPLYFVEGGKQEVFKLDVLYKAGNVYHQNPLVASFANALVGEGTSKKISKEINEAFDFEGAYFEKGLTKDLSILSLSGMSETMGKILPLFYEVLVDSIFPEEEFKIALKNRKAKFQNNQKKVEYVCRNAFSELLFGAQHPYGQKLVLEHFETLRYEDVVQFYQNYFLKGELVIVFAGKIDAENKKTLIEIVSQLPAQQQIGTVNEPFSYIPKKEKIAIPKTVQSAIRFGKPTITYQNEDFAKLIVTNAVFGGYFGSRLMKNIREEKGYTYGIGSNVSPLLSTGILSIATEAGKDVTEATIHEIRYEIERMQNQLVPEDELEMAKNYLLGSFLRSIDGPFSQASRIKNVILYQLDDTYYERYLSAIENTTSEEVLKMAQTYLTKDSFTELVVGS